MESQRPLWETGKEVEGGSGRYDDESQILRWFQEEVMSQEIFRSFPGARKGKKMDFS